MKFIEFILSLFKKKEQPVRAARDIEIPPPAEHIAPEPKPTLAIKEVENPWMYGPATYINDPDEGQKPLKGGKPVGVVIHHTATYNLNATVEYFKKNVVDVHFVVGHDGKVVQMVPCNMAADHAGESEWDGKKWLNNYYIGIEVVNIGWLKKVGDLSFVDGYKRPWVGKVRVRDTQGEKYWEPFTDSQEQAVEKLCVWLCKEYGIKPENIVGHFECSPGRKNDPAGGFSVTFDQFRMKISKSLKF
jgi:N-acetylmuramoyl-L-alanine amidase